MLKASYRIIYNRKKKLNSRGQAIIQVEARIPPSDRRRLFSTGVYIQPHQWDERNQRVIKHADQDQMNQVIENMIDQLKSYERECIKDGRRITIDALRAAIDQDYNPGSFEEFMQYSIRMADIKESSRRQHVTALGHMKRFGGIDRFADLTYQNIERLDAYLRDRGLHQNTRHSVHKRLKTYINKAISSGIMRYEQNPYLKFKTKRDNSIKRKFMDTGELEKIRTHRFANKKLERIRDIFMFLVFTGFDFEVAMSLTPEDVLEINRQKWIITNREKTGIRARVPLLPPAQRVIEKFDIPNRLLPKITNQKMNDYLKEVALVCDIGMHLTCRVARHTFATTVALANDVPLETLKEMMGHANIRTTEIYARMLDLKIRNDTDALRKKFGDPS